MTGLASPDPGESVLVTGARGLLGSALLPLLRRGGDRVRVWSRSAAPIAGAAEVVAGRLHETERLRGALAGVRAVYHLAAITRKWLPRRAAFEEVNVAAAIGVARAAADAGVERVVHVSSFTVYGPSPSGAEIDEDAPLAGDLQNDYQRSKRRAHERLLDLVEREGLPVVIACPGVLFGPAPPAIENPIAELMRKQLTGRLRAFPRGGASRWTLSYLPDVARGLRLARQHGAPGRAYLLGGHVRPLREVFAWVGRQSGRASPAAVPLWPFLAAGRAVELLGAATRRAPRLTCGALRFLARDWAFSSARAVAELGYEITPLEVALSAVWRELHAGASTAAAVRPDDDGAPCR